MSLFGYWIAASRLPNWDNRYALKSFVKRHVLAINEFKSSDFSLNFAPNVFLGIIEEFKLISYYSKQFSVKKSKLWSFSEYHSIGLPFWSTAFVLKPQLTNVVALGDFYLFHMRESIINMVTVKAFLFHGSEIRFFRWTKTSRYNLLFHVVWN